MIKKLQQLKAKKGFTLVELIVVIAIIGVLAAILIPTMLNYITGAKVTSLNSTVSSIKNDVSGWYTDLDGKGFTVDRGAPYVITLTIAAPGAVTAAGTGIVGGVAPAGGMFKKAPANINGSLQDKISELYPKLSQSWVQLQIDDGTIYSAILVDGGAPATTPSYGGIAIGGAAPTNKWTGLGYTTSKKDGVLGTGEIFGSYPIATIANGDA